MGKTALISVFDKTGVVPFAQGLSALGYRIVSTGGTYRLLSENGIEVIEVSDLTGFPECLDGRVKTLHPLIHAGILYMRDNAQHVKQAQDIGVDSIDIVAVNLYPFKQTIQKANVTLEECVENIDIGGPTMLRAAAKNWQDVVAITDPSDYEPVLTKITENGQVDRDTKFALATNVFHHTAAYDAMISEYLRKQGGADYFPPKLTYTFDLKQSMRYGENPHQKAAFYSDPIPPSNSLAVAEQLQGKELSYNNIGDADGALDLLREFDTTAVVAVKHANPCGVGVADTVYEAFQKAYEADPVSIFGGIVVTNDLIDEDTAKKLAELFLEIVVAPEYSQEALDVLKKKKNLRVLRLDTRNNKVSDDTIVAKKVYGGLLVQDYNNTLLPDESQLKVVTKVAPTGEQWEDLFLAWKIVKHTKSNGIAIAKAGQSLGVGPGQVNRIWAAEMALERSGEKVVGAALASDAYFPFDDCVKAAQKAGIACIIQPGGSIRDKDSIAACDEAGIAMVFTGMRHFKH
jgi:phosphoribosylaminoimidazolecarboxamide formyltransferase/IMP cyclohydrolase